MKRIQPGFLLAFVLVTAVVTWNPILLPHIGEAGIVEAWIASVSGPIQNAGLGWDDAFLLRWLPSLAIAGMIAWGAWATGSLLARIIPLPKMRAATEVAICFLAGMGVLSPVLAICGLFADAGRMFALAGFLMVTVGAVKKHRYLKLPRKRSWNPVLAAILLFVFGMALVAALTPPVQSDGLRYHLVAAQEWHYRGFDAYLRFNSFTNLPNLLALASSLAWPHAEVFALLHVVGFVALVQIAGELAASCVRAVDPGSEQAAVDAARVLTATIPVIAIVASWPFADVISAAAVLACAATGLVSLEHGAAAKPTAVWMGLCAGTAAAFKITTGPMAFAVGAVVLFWWIRLQGRSVRQFRMALVGCGVAAIPLLPFLFRNFANVGNPLYFPLPGIDGMGDWTAECAGFYAAKAAEKGFGHGGLMLIFSPILLTFRWDAFEAQNPGPALLAMLLLATQFASRRGRSPTSKQPLFVMVGVTWALWFIGYQSTRFAMVPMVMIAALAGAAWAREFANSKSRIARMMPVWLSVPGLTWIVWWSAFASATPPLQAAFAPRENVLSRGFNSYPTILALEKHLQDTRPNEAESRSIRVFYIGEHRGTYADAFEPAHSDWFDTPRILNSIRGTKTNDEILREWPKRRVDYVLVNLAELRLYVGLYFRPRFSVGEWTRFEALLTELRNRRILGDDSIFVAEVRDNTTAPEAGSPRTR